jgi:hypothetical protein
MKGVQLVYDFATFRRPSQMVGEPGGAAPIARPEDVELQVPLNPQQQSNLPMDGHEPPGTPAISTFEVDDEFNLPISVAIVILVIYIFVGAVIYWTWENWGFFESFYFVFISMSTIGFGDFVPQVNPAIVLLCTERRDIYRSHWDINCSLCMTVHPADSTYHVIQKPFRFTFLTEHNNCDGPIPHPGNPTYYI